MDNHVAPPLKLRRHLLYRLLRAAQRRDGRFLRNGICIVRRLTLDFRRGLDDIRRSSHVAYPPAGHRVGLGNAVDGNDAILHALERTDAHVGSPVKDHLFIDLIAHHKDPGFLHNARDSAASSRVSATPVGFPGELSNNTRVRGVTAFRRRRGSIR